MRAFGFLPLTKVLVALAAGLAMLASQVLAAPLTDAQKDALRQYFNTNANIASVASGAAGLLDDEKLSGFFEKYGDALTLANLANEVAAGNNSAVLKAALEKLSEAALAKMASLDPAIATFSSGLNAVGWAWTAMGLANDFVVEPARLDFQLDLYADARRNKLEDPSAAMGYTRDPGQIRLLALEEFVNVRGKDVLVPGTTDTLKPELEAELTDFTNRWFEKMYQDRLAEEAKAALLAKAAAARAELAALETELLAKLGTTPPVAGVPDDSIALLLDASGSMADDGRMDKAKAAARDVIGQMKGNVEVALIVFFECGDVRTVTEFTRDPAPLLAALEPILPSGGTPLAEGIGYAKEYLRTKGTGTTRRLVVLTDGAESCAGDLVGAAKE
jgi:hypothetical protein